MPHYLLHGSQPRVLVSLRRRAKQRDCIFFGDISRIKKQTLQKKKLPVTSDQRAKAADVLTNTRTSQTFNNNEKVRRKWFVLFRLPRSCTHVCGEDRSQLQCHSGSALVQWLRVWEVLLAEAAALSENALAVAAIREMDHDVRHKSAA